MGLFGMINYEDYILKTIVRSEYARNGLFVLLTYTITGLVQFHLSIILSYLLSYGYTFDFFVPIIVTSIMSLSSQTIYRYVETHRNSYEWLVDHVIMNYSKDNFIKWKRFILLGIAVYIFLCLAFVSIDNQYIFVTTLQTMMSFAICDSIENKIPDAVYCRFVNWLDKIQHYELDNMTNVKPLTKPPPSPPRCHTCTEIHEVKIHDGSQIHSVHDVMQSCNYDFKIPDKPDTPPKIKNRFYHQT